MPEQYAKTKNKDAKNMDVKFIGENLQHANTIYSDKKRSLRYSYNFDYFLFVIMPQKKNLRNFDDMPVIIFKNRIIIALLCAAMLLMGGCKKTVENICQVLKKKAPCRAVQRIHFIPSPYIH